MMYDPAANTVGVGAWAWAVGARARSAARIGTAATELTCSRQSCRVMLWPPGVVYPTDHTTINLTSRARPALIPTIVSRYLRLFCLAVALLGSGFASAQT